MNTQRNINDIIRIGDFGIATDEYNFILYEILTVQKEDSKNHGKEYLANPTYHSTFTRVIDKILSTTEKNLWPNLDDILKSHKEILNYIEQLEKLPTR